MKSCVPGRALPLVLLALLCTFCLHAGDYLVGGLRREIYTNVPGTRVKDLTSLDRFPAHPDSVERTTSFETPNLAGDNYGQRLVGYILPPASGNYVFYLAADDEAVLYLSSDNQPSNKVIIAHEWSWVFPRSWTGLDGGRTNIDNISAPIELQAGKAYYVEALHKEGGGGDNFGVTWQLPEGPVPENGSDPISGAYLAYGVADSTNHAPTVSVSWPTTGSVFIGPTNIVLGANASDPDGDPLTVDFWAGTMLLGKAGGPFKTPYGNYLFIWSNPPAGTFPITARATDSHQASTRSEPVMVTVNAQPPPDDTFSLPFFSCDQNPCDQGTVFWKKYTRNGPVEGGALLPGLMLITDASDTGMYAAYYQDIYKVDSSTGSAKHMLLPSTLPELSWPMGMTFDSKRNRVLLASLGGEGYLYSYDPNNDAWSLLASMQNLDVDSIVYHGADDSLYAFEVHHGTGPGRLFKFSAAGVPLGEIQLPEIPYTVGVAAHRSELISVGDEVLLFIGRDKRFSEPGPFESRIYAIKPATGEAQLTYSHIEQENPAPSVTLTTPASGALFPPGADVNLIAKTEDPDNKVTSVQFYAGDRLIGQGTSLDSTRYAFGFLWKAVPAGNYTLTAKALYGEGLSAVSAPVQITVRSDEGPAKEFHIVSVYSGDFNGGVSPNHEEGEVPVVVNRPGKALTLYFSAYEPVVWKLTVMDGTVIDRVFLSGYYTQRVEGLPPGVPVVNGEVQKLPWAGYNIDGPEFYQALPKLIAFTGMRLSSYHGSYGPFQNPPVIINSVQDDPRLSPEYPVPTPTDQLPALKFLLTFFSGTGVGNGSVFSVPYTLTGPSFPPEPLPMPIGFDGRFNLLPGLRVVPEASGNFYYAAYPHNILQVSSSGNAVTIEPGAGLPELSWPTSATVDKKRNRILVSSLGGEGFLYAYDPVEPGWSLVSSLQNYDLDSIVHHAADDSIYGFEVYRAGYSRPRLHKFSSTGAHQGTIELPLIQFDVGLTSVQSELVSVEDYLVLIIAPDLRNGPGSPGESRMYLIDPRSGQSWLSYRNRESLNQSPSVTILSPPSGTTLPGGKPVEILARASDPDGRISRVEFFANSTALGLGTAGDNGTFRVVWPNPTPGTWWLLAKATDNLGATASATVSLLIKEVEPVSFVKREISANTVRLITQPANNIAVYALEDTPPAGWTIDEIQDGGVFDPVSGKVKFGPFFDAQPRAFSYQAFPPPGFVGVGIVHGTASADGQSTPIIGDDKIVVVSYHPADNNPADWIMKMDEVTLYASVWRTGGVWNLPPNPIPIDYVTRAVALWRGGEAYTLDPSLGEPPACWINPPDKEIQIIAPYSVPVVIRQAPDEVVAGDLIPVSIKVSSAGSVSGYAVEELCPENCIVSSVSDGGHFDSVHGLIKWGPFLDSLPRVLHYQISASSKENVVFQGKASFDGAGILIGGLPEARLANRLQCVSKAAEDGFDLHLAGRAGTVYLVEVSTNMIAWSPLVRVTAGDRGVNVPVSPRAETRQLFYRARPQ